MSSVFLYTDAEKEFLEKLKPFAKTDWDNAIDPNKNERGFASKRDELKKRIKEELYNIQGDFCIYCGMNFERTTPHQDHIAPKHSHNEFIFEPQNLVLACPTCNDINMKSGRETIDIKNPVDYHKCTFLIVHPYFDNYEDHIEFVSNQKEQKILIKSKSLKGKRTIEMFNLDNTELSNKRAAFAYQDSIKIDEETAKEIDIILNAKYNLIYKI